MWNACFSAPSDTDAAISNEAGTSQELGEASRNEDDPRENTRQKKRHRDTSVDKLLQVLQEAKQETAERFERKMALLERLVQAVEGKRTQDE